MLSPKRVVPVEKQPPAAEPGDVSEPNRSPEGLRTSEIRYRRLFESARDGILILDAATLRITDVNPFMTELLGYSSEEFLGKELWEIGFFSDKDASQAAFRELQETGYIRFEDLPLQTVDGELREVEFVSNVYEEDSQQVIQCNIRDISERKRSQEECTRLLESAMAARAEADAANGIKDEFLALLSHELRTPLTSVLGWSKMLIDGKLDEATSKRALEIIVRNARAQNKLIDDLLDISRINTGKLRLDLRPVALAPMIEIIVDGVRPAADARSIRLRISDCRLRIEEKRRDVFLIRHPKSAIRNRQARPLPQAVLTAWLRKRRQISSNSDWGTRKDRAGRRCGSLIDSLADGLKVGFSGQFPDDTAPTNARNACIMRHAPSLHFAGGTRMSSI
jgi:PAS domain S-box-containing protein